MKVRIKTFNGELPEYLTEGRVYEAHNINISKYNIYFSIVCDDGVLINTRLHECML